nr:ChbG/HpnK family deacetylase [Allomuricauda sp.]
MVRLIINADDFGMSRIYNDCIIDLLDQGKITSTTVMVNRVSDSQKSQVERLKKLIKAGDISVGLHVEFTYDQHLEQVQLQLQKFEKLFTTTPSHLDIHKEHLHTKYHPIVAEYCRSKNLPFRNHGEKFPGVATTTKKYFYGSIKDFEPIDSWLKGLEERQYFELVFHPGKYDPDCFSSLNKEREWDLAHIETISQRLKEYKIELGNFHHLHNSNLSIA